MYIYDTGYIYDTISNEYVTTAEREVYLSNLLSLGFDKLYNYFKSDTIIPVFRFFKLTANETVETEVSDDVINANINISSQSGQRRSQNMTLANHNNQWKYSARGNIWVGTKFRMDVGIVIENTVYWQQQGVFILNDFAPSIDNSNRTINLSLCDKWGLWDGSVYGNTEFKTIIPTQVPMREAFNTIMHESNNLGNMWDIKPIRFNAAHWDTLTYYTIKQDAGQPKSQFLLDMAKTISSDVYYDAKGYCNVESNVLDFVTNNFPVIWRFEEGDADCGTISLKYNRTEYYNFIKVKGAIVNGYQFTGSTENTNRQSLYNVYDIPRSSKIIDNPKLYSDNLCLEQSQYEMVKQSRGIRAVTLTCSCLPFLDVNKAVFLNFPSANINGIYIIDSISYQIGSDCKMNLSLTSMNEVIF